MDYQQFKRSLQPDPDNYAQKRTPALVSAIWILGALGVLLLFVYGKFQVGFLLPIAGISLAIAFTFWYMTKPLSEDEEHDD